MKIRSKVRNIYTGVGQVIGIILLMSLLSVGISSATPVVEWQKTYGLNGDAVSVHQTSDRGYIFANVYNNLGITKVDSKGNLQWNKLSGYNVYSVEQTKDGGYIATIEDNLYHVLLMKTGSTGITQWKKDIGSGNIGTDSVHQTNDGGYILAYNANGRGIVAKTDSNGAIQWNKSYEYSQGYPYGYPYSAKQTTDGGYIAAGELNGHPWLVKIDSKGNKQWSKSYNYGSDWGAFSIQQTSDGGYIFTVPGTTNKAVVKVDSKGNEQWNKKQGDNNSFDVVGLTNDGGYILAGIIYNNVGRHAIITKVDSKGNDQWEKINSQKDSYGNSIEQTKDSGYILAGTLGNNALLIKFSADNSLTVVSPNGGEKWKHGTTHTISWTSVGNPGANVKIELLRGTKASQIVSSAKNTGSYSWKIPATQTPGTNYKIRVTSTTNKVYTDTSNKNFTIVT